MYRKMLFLLAGLLLTFTLAFAGTAFSAEGPTVESLEKLIKEQQQQFESLIQAQQQQMQALQTQLEQLKQTATDAQIQAKEAKTVAEEIKTVKLDPVNKTVISGSEKVKITLSGQINRAINVVDDGDKTEAYFVDNDASNSRFRMVGTANLNKDLTLGTRLEVAVAPNESSDVSQDDPESGDFFDQRYADISLASKRYGKVYLGKGDTASNNSAEVDLSGTDVIQYASVADIAGGMLFRQSGDDILTSTSLGDAFKDFDGLSRKSRLRYDTPTFYGASLAASIISDQRWDTSAWWNGVGYGFKIGAAAAVAYIKDDIANYQYDGSLSVLHEATGLSFTFSSGTKDSDTQDNPYNIWGKIGWQTELTPLGKTAFGIDYGHSENVSAEGDEGDTFGVAVVQDFADYGTQLYSQYRNYSLDRNSDPNVSDINVGTFGVRVKF